MRHFLVILVLTFSAVLPAGAVTIEERIAAELMSQGYEILESNRTWLGRLRIVAENDEIRREIVINPGTGEILRDYSVMLTVLEQRTRELARAGSAASSTTSSASGVASAVASVGGDGSGTSTGADGNVGVVTTSVEPDSDPDREVAIPLLPKPLNSPEGR